jgi:hypothetical protein
MRVNCGDCTVRGIACPECVIGSLLLAPPGTAEFDGGELDALTVLAEAGLVPPLRWSARSLPTTVTNVTAHPGPARTRRSMAGLIGK